MNLPQWTCHKTVEGFKIARIVAQPRGTASGNVLEPQEVKVPRADGKVDIMFSAMHTEYLLSDETGEFFAVVSDGYMEKHGPYIDGYYVRYSDGYESFSPTDAFEDGYVQRGKRRVLHVVVDENSGHDHDTLRAMAEMFHQALTDDQASSVGTVIATIEGVSAELIDVQDSPDVELVTVYASNHAEQEPVEVEAPVVQYHVLHIYPDGAPLPEARRKFEIHVNNMTDCVRAIRGRSVQHIVLHDLTRAELLPEIAEAAFMTTLTFEMKYSTLVMWEEV